MEKFIHIYASMYKKSLTTQSNTEQELPKDHAQQNPTHKIDSLQKELKKNLFGKADSFSK